MKKLNPDKILAKNIEIANEIKINEALNKLHELNELINKLLENEKTIKNNPDKMEPE